MKIKSLALSLLGRPFVHGATLADAPRSFYDPSFVRFVLLLCRGIELPVTAVEQAVDKRGEVIPFNPDNLGNLREGDLLFSEGTKNLSGMLDGKEIKVGHVAIYIGNGETVNSRRSKGGVIRQTVSELHQDPSLGGIVLVKRFII